MIGMRLTSDVEKLGSLRGAMAGMLSAAADAARANAPERTGALRASIEAFITGPGAGTIKAAAPYASFVHDGTGIYGASGSAYTISARVRKALFWPGAAHPVRSVRVQGMAGRPFITDALDGSAIDQAVQRLIDTL